MWWAAGKEEAVTPQLTYYQYIDRMLLIESSNNTCKY
jgi:hypothetical protein